MRPLWDLGTLLGASDRTVIIVGAPRSGTTWLLEMLERAARGRRIVEPFLYFEPRRSAEHNFGLGWRPYLAENEGHPPMEDYLRRLLRGNDVTFRQANAVPSHGRLGFAYRLLFARCTVIKMCRGMRLLPWMDERVSVPVTLLIRHPLAVIASQLEHPDAWNEHDGSHPVLCTRVRQKHPTLVEYAEGLDYLEQKLAATWAFDYLIPLERWGSLDNVQLVTYESLVRLPTSTIRRVLEHLGLSGDADRARADEPSATTRADSNVAVRSDPLSTWQRRLSDREVSRILDVVHTFGLDFYDSSLMPNRKGLARALEQPDGTSNRPDGTLPSAEDRS